MENSTFHKKLLSLQNGSFDVLFNNKRYLLTKEIFSEEKIIKVYAKELGGKDIVSGNYFLTIKNGLLKPCEMNDEKVINFITNLKVL